MHSMARIDFCLIGSGCTMLIMHTMHAASLNKLKNLHTLSPNNKNKRINTLNYQRQEFMIGIGVCSAVTAKVTRYMQI